MAGSFEDLGLQVDVPHDWVVRPGPALNIVVAHPQQYVGRRLIGLPKAFAAIRAHAVPDLTDWAEALMARRVVQGAPDRFAASISGATAMGFDWTDGVADVISVFASSPDGTKYEFEFSRDAFDEHLDRSLTAREEAEGWMRRVHWGAAGRR